MLGARWRGCGVALWGLGFATDVFLHPALFICYELRQVSCIMHACAGARSSLGRCWFQIEISVARDHVAHNSRTELKAYSLFDSIYVD